MWCGGGPTGVPLLLWILRVFCFIILKFQSFQFFFLSFCVSSKTFVWNFTRGARGYFPFFLWTFESFLFLYFDVLESLIFFLSSWASSNFWVKFHKGGNRVFSFLLETSKVFCFGILKFRSFQFSSCHFGGLQFFGARFSQTRKRGYAPFSCEFWKFSIFVFWKFEMFNFLLVILEVSHGGK